MDAALPRTPTGCRASFGEGAGGLPGPAAVLNPTVAVAPGGGAGAEAGSDQDGLWAAAGDGDGARGARSPTMSSFSPYEDEVPEFLDGDFGDLDAETRAASVTLISPVGAGRGSASGAPLSPTASGYGTSSEFDDADAPLTCFGRVDRALALRWAANETHTMLIHWLGTPHLKRLPRDRQLLWPGIRLNPLYWLLLWLPVVVVMVLGRFAHGAVGQGGKVRPDEAPEEHEARVQWMYTLSGWFVQMVIFDCVLLGIYAAEGDLDADSTLPPHRPLWEIQALHIVVSVMYFSGNAVFIRAMRLRHRFLVRFSIAANISFAVALCGALVWYIVRHENSEGVPPTLRVLRLLAIGFFLACQAVAGYIYAKLWSFYAGEEATCADAVAKAFLVLFSLMVIGVVFLAIASPSVGPYVWSALIGF